LSQLSSLNFSLKIIFLIWKWKYMTDYGTFQCGNKRRLSVIKERHSLDTAFGTALKLKILTISLSTRIFVSCASGIQWNKWESYENKPSLWNIVPDPVFLPLATIKQLKPFAINELCEMNGSCADKTHTWKIKLFQGDQLFWLKIDSFKLNVWKCCF